MINFLKNNQVELYIVFLLLSRVLFSLVLVVLGENEASVAFFNQAEWFLLVLFSLYIIFRNRGNGWGVFEDKTVWALGAFFVLYLMRIQVAYLQNAIHFSKYLQVLGRYFGNVFLPVIALSTIKELHIHRLVKMMFGILVAFFSVEYIGYMFDCSRIYFVTYGLKSQLSGLLIVLSLWYGLENRKIPFYIGWFLGLYGLFFISRKAPFIGVALVLFLIIYRMIKLGKSIKIKPSVVIFTLMIFGLVYINSLEVVSRFSGFVSASDASTIERAELLRVAWQSFVQSPIWGHSLLLEGVRVSYPHNIYAEALMAVGVLGTLGLVYYVYQILKVGRQLAVASHQKFALVMVAIYYISQSFFNGSLYWVTPFWVSTYLLWLLAQERIKIKA